jgi:hypothetical protein
MSFLSRILARLGRGRVEAADSRVDHSTDHSAERATPDRHSTTGTSQSGTFVGQPSGEDAGYLETGAERRPRNAGPPASDEPGAR